MARTYTSAPVGNAGGPEFVLDGVTFKCVSVPSLMDLTELARLAETGMDSITPEAMAIIAEFLTSAMGKKEYRRFRTHARDHGTDPQMVMEILQGIVEDFVARPTPRPSDSPDGPPATPTTSMRVSFSAGTVEELPPGETPPVETVEERPLVRTFG